MEGQEQLWATPQRQKAIRLTVERLWAKGETVVGLTTTVVGSKGSNPLWSSYQEYESPNSLVIAQHVAEADLARFLGPLWNVEPKRQAEEAWVRHLLT